ncbi:unnamed protein product, partial [Prorocentrum cordatum]
PFWPKASLAPVLGHPPGPAAHAETMARARSPLSGALLAAAALCLCAQLLAPAFVQPRAARAQEVDPALAGAVAGLLALPGDVLAEGGKIPGAPLAGSPVCLSKPLVWLIYPLCDLVFLTSPSSGSVHDGTSTQALSRGRAGLSDRRRTPPYLARVGRCVMGGS